jgi:hypothetical protein
VGYVDYSSTTPVSFTDGSLPSAELAQNNDRLRYTPSLGVRTAVSPALSLEARAGIDIQSLTTDPELTGVSQEGESTTVFSREKSFETLSYSATANYLPLDGTSGATGEVYQSGGSDIDGQRLTIRGLSLTSFHRFNERIQGIVSGRYLQYSYENSLTNASERWESTVSLRYQLTETLEVSSGWNFANQNSSGSEADEEGYESHRFFIALSGSMSL